MNLKNALIAILSVFLFSSVSAQVNMAKKKEKTFVVLELFTAEGCASCTEADALLSKMKKNSEKDGAEIYYLNYHVPYWDNLGWKDEYASKKFEAHQDFYNSYLPVQKSYTPQLIVNGTTEFTGSDEGLIKRSVEDAFLHNKPNYIAELKAQKIDSAKISVLCNLVNLPPNCQLQLVLVEKDLPATAVKSGENKGNKVFHYSAVRYMETIAIPKDTNKVVLNYKLPKLNGKYVLIAYVQDKEVRDIYSVEQVKIKLQ